MNHRCLFCGRRPQRVRLAMPKLGSRQWKMLQHVAAFPAVDAKSLNRAGGPFPSLTFDALYRRGLVEFVHGSNEFTDLVYLTEKGGRLLDGETLPSVSEEEQRQLNAQRNAYVTEGHRRFQRDRAR